MPLALKPTHATVKAYYETGQLFILGFHLGKKKRGLERPRPFFVCMIPSYLVEKGKPANFAKIYSAYLQ